MRKVTMKKIVLLTLLSFPILLFGQEDSSKDTPLVKLEGIGIFKIGKTTTSELEKMGPVKTVTPMSLMISKEYLMEKGVFVDPKPSHPAIKTYYILNYELNSEINIDLKLEFYQDTLYEALSSNQIRAVGNGYCSYGTKKLLDALEIAGYLKNKTDLSSIKTYQNRMGATFERENTIYNYDYNTNTNIIGEGYFEKEYITDTKTSSSYYIVLYNSLIKKKVSSLIRELMEQKIKSENQKLTEGL